MARGRERDLLDLVMRRLQSAEKHMQPIMERVFRARKVYLGTTNPDKGRVRRSEDPTDWRSMLFPPVANEQAELMFAEMSVDDPRFSYTARVAAFDGNARAAEQAVDYFNDRDRFGRTFRMATRATIRDGGAPIQTTWRRDEHGEWGTSNQLLRLEDVFPDPTATDFGSCRWVVVRSRATLDELKAVGIYEGLHRLADRPGGRDTYEQKREGETQEAFDAARTGVHTLHTQWTPFERVVVANRQHVILRQANPYGWIPLTMVRLIDDEDCIVGVSPMTLIDELQEAYWFALNSLMDAIHFSVNPPRLADIEEDSRSGEYPVYPGAVIPARNGESTVKVLQDVANLDKYNVAQLVETLRATMERITGMNSAIAGVSLADTATEAAINVRQGKGRVNAMLAVSDECWAQVATRTYGAIQKFATDGVVARLSSGQTVSFMPDDLVDMMISPKPASAERSLVDLERQDAQAALNALLGLVNPADPSGIPRVNLEPVVRRLVDAFKLPPETVVSGVSPGSLPPAGPAAPPVDSSGVAGGAPPDPLAADAPTVVGPRPEGFIDGA